MEVVLIYTGGKTPNYVFSNMKNLKLKFPKIKIRFISDSADAISRAHNLGIATWKCDDPSIAYLEIKQGLEHPMEFRNAFWFHTIARLLILRDFMLIHDAKNVLHLECDIWVASDFPFNDFKGLEKGISFPMLPNGLGAGSILFVRDPESSVSLGEYVTNAVLIDRTVTDMHILGNLARSRPDLVQILPTIDVSPPFKGLFDAADWGMYLFGEDPRNHQGKLKLFCRKYIGSNSIELGKFLIGDRPTLKAIVGAYSYPLYCLHIHSKDARVFESATEGKVISKRVDQSKEGPRDERRLMLTFRLACSAIRRRFAKRFL